MTALRHIFLAGIASLLPLAGTAADIKTGLVSYWNFDKKDFKDSVGHFDGTGNGSAPIEFVAGKSGFGLAMKLDGVDQFVEITGGDPAELAFQGASMTVAGWFQVGAFDKSWQALIAKGEGSNWRIHRRGSESGFAHAGGTGEGPAGGAVDDGAWHHFAAISDADGVNFGTRLYIDGVNYTENASVPSLADNGKAVMIGENPDARGRTWNGLVDDIAIWNRVLTESEIATLVKGGTGTALSSLLGSGPTDTDKDGMPDDWENQYGLNPNDASDAAKDKNGNGITNLDEFKAGFDPGDTVKPTITSVKSTGSFDTVSLTFSKPLDPTTAANVANYAITPALAISGATLKGNVVTLATAKQAAGGTAYTVTVNNVKSVNSLVIAANTKTTFYSYVLTRTGVARFAYWGNIGGTPVDGLYSDPRYPATPDLTAAVFSFNSRDAFPDDSHENYGAVIEGYLTPSESGNYRFFIYSDDASQLFLSTDDKEANLNQIAEETSCCNNFTEPDSPRTSEPIALVGGKKYFIRMVYKEGGGGDYGQVAWRKEGDPTPAGSLRPIAGKFLSSAVDLPAPAEGVFSVQTPAPNATKVSPGTAITIVHTDGKTPWTTANVSLKFDGNTVTPTITKDGAVMTIVYQPPALLPSKTRHYVTIGYPNPAGAAATLDYSFETSLYSGPVKDQVKGYNALLIGNAIQTPDGGGGSGKAGDRALDTTSKGGPAQVIDADFLTAVNAATANDELSVSVWINKYDIADSSAFWFSSPSQSRVFQAHTPWSNNNIYFDTAGCCDSGTQRINAGIDTFPDYSGDVSWWQKWRLYVFTKKKDAKQIWVDGKLFLEGSNTGPLSTDINQLMIGADNGGGGLMHAKVDDFAVYSKALTAADITSLKNGTKPGALGAGAGLIAWWNFDTAKNPAATIPNGIVAYWNFDGNLNDSVRDSNGTGKGTDPIAFVPGKEGFGKALALNGKDQYIDIGGNENTLDFAKGSVSIAGWFKVGAFDKSWQALLSKGENSNYRIARRGDGGSIAYAGGAGEGADDGPPVNDGLWHHFVAVSDATGAAGFGTALYVDGVLKSIQATKPVITDSSKHLFLGENPDATGRQWNGWMDDIAIWNRVLTADEVGVLYNGGVGLALSTFGDLHQQPSDITLTAARSGANITVSWAPAGGTLESSPTLGPGATWTTVGPANPATVVIGSGNLYLRVKK